MFIEKIKVIRDAEENAAQRKNTVTQKVKQMIADAEKDGTALLARTESEMFDAEKDGAAKAEADAAEIMEHAVSDAKSKTVAQKVDAALNIAEAVKIIIEELHKEWR